METEGPKGVAKKAVEYVKFKLRITSGSPFGEGSPARVAPQNPTSNEARHASADEYTFKTVAEIFSEKTRK
jgi:hypothetical protein